MTPAKSAVPQRQSKGTIGRKRKRGPGGTSTKPIEKMTRDPRKRVRRRRFKFPQGHGRPTPGPRTPRSPRTPFKGVHRDTRKVGGRRDGTFKKRRIRNRFTRR